MNDLKRSEADPQEIARIHAEMLASMAANNRVLRGLEGIGHYLRASTETARRYIDREGLPAVKMQRRFGQPIWVTTTSLVDQWLMTMGNLQRQGRWPSKDSEMPAELSNLKAQADSVVPAMDSSTLGAGVLGDMVLD